MASQSGDETAGMTAGAARRQIQTAEASRMLGLPIGIDLSASAALWIRAGIDTGNSRALAGATAEVSDGVRVALLAELAAEIGVAFASTREARTLHAEELVRSMGAGENVGLRLYNLANGYTDELTASLRRLLGRLRRGSSA